MGQEELLYLPVQSTSSLRWWVGLDQPCLIFTTISHVEAHPIFQKRVFQVKAWTLFWLYASFQALFRGWTSVTIKVQPEIHINFFDSTYK